MASLHFFYREFSEATNIINSTINFSAIYVDRTHKNGENYTEYYFRRTGAGDGVTGHAE